MFNIYQLPEFLRFRGTRGKNLWWIDPTGAPKHVDFLGLRRDECALHNIPCIEVKKILSQSDEPKLQSK